MNFQLKQFTLLFTILWGFSAFSEDIPLKSEWVFRNAKKQNWLPAKVPGEVHLDLLRNKKIDDPYYRNNEIEQRWIEFEDWEYKTTIDANESLLQNEHIELVFKGLDTYADVYLNNQLLLSADNMFREWIVDVKPYLKSGENELKIFFHSTINKNRDKVENGPYELPAANETVDLKVSPYVRKAAYQFGWDWGPRFVGCGIWRPIFIRTWNSINVQDVSYSTLSLSKENAVVEFSFEIYSANKESIPVQLTVHENQTETSLKPGLNIIKQKIQINNPKTWNPKNYGPQHFYNSGYSIQSKGITLKESDFNFAIRQIELIHEPDSIGTSFYFKVNGKPFYAKGANYIPQDIFLTRVDSSKYEALIKQAVEANFNMIRVWGGGIYENDYFYDLCDQNGILVWQDFMFANSMYPKDDAFKANLKEEVTYNIKRLRNHPCIALWCGNNEIEVAWGNWGWQLKYRYSKADSAEIWNTYTGIFHEMIPGILNDLDPQRPYVSTSPLSNWGKKENFNHSSMHYWGVWHGREPFENFEKFVGRFVAEYGYQSFPSYKTLQKVLIEEDFDLGSEVMKNRQKSYIGNGIIAKNIKKYAYNETDFAKWIELSQLVQAHAMGFAIRQHRIKTPHCMGTLFWQLNDCWPGPSWSVIDYYGNQKSAYNDVKKYYKPVIASIKEDRDYVYITVVSDSLQKLPLNAEFTILDENEKVIHSKKSRFMLNTLQPEIIKISLPRRVVRRKALKKELFSYCIRLEIGDKMIFEDHYYPEKNTTINFPIK